MKVLLVDGEWCLKRSFNARKDLFSFKGEHCGGVYGFLETLGSTINKVLPDRVVVVWDGERSGQLRHDIYPLYKADHKEWDAEAYMRTEAQLDAEMRSKVSCSNQKLKTKNLLDGLFIRQAEVDLIEGDDLIALYVQMKEKDEQVIIFSRDKDYYQLVDENVYVLRPADNIIVTPTNFKSLFGYIKENALMLKCIEGDSGDNVAGVPKVAYTTIVKYFPKFKDEVYTIDRFVDEAFELYHTKKHKVLENIMGSRGLCKRNKILMDLRNPLVNEEAIKEVEIIRECVMAKEGGQVDRSIQDAMSALIKEGYTRFMYNNDINTFLLPYQRIATKEKEYTRKILEG
jgi:5'-3' exonuclease